MGFGYGHKTSHSGQAVNRETGERVASRFSNDMAAHVWAQRTQTFGQSSNGNLYFEDDAIYSYGSHFLVAYLLDIGGEVVALLNSDSYSSTTSQHKGDASGACSQYQRLDVPSLTALRDVLPTLAEYPGKPAALRRAAAKEEGWEAKRAIRVVREWLGTFDIADDSEVTSRDGSYTWTREGNAKGARLVAKAAGLTDSDVARIQRERVKKVAAGKLATEKAERERNLREAKYLATMTDSDFRAKWPDDGDRQWNKGDGDRPWPVRSGDEFSAKLLRLQRAAKSKGWTRIAAELAARRKEYREHFAGRNERIYAAHRAKLAAEVRRWRAGGERPRNALLFPAAIKRAIERSQRLERAEKSAAEFAEWQAGNRARPSLGLHETDSPEWAAIAESIREERAAYVAQAELFLAGGEAPQQLSYSARAEDLPEDIGAQTWRTVEQGVAREVERRESAARFAREARQREDWLAGIANGWHGSDESGGALMRVRGDLLETSQGASVPLAHAVRVFRFVKLCRERGEAWQRNGHTIRVGHFTLDRIESSGDFTAGCHRFAWPEVERVAGIAGVVDAAPSAEAVEQRESA